MLKQAREACVSQREQALANSVQRRQHSSAFRRGSASYAPAQHKTQVIPPEPESFKPQTAVTTANVNVLSSEPLSAGSNLDLDSSQLGHGVSVVEVTPQQQEQLQAQLDSAGGLTVEQLQMSK